MKTSFMKQKKLACRAAFPTGFSQARPILPSVPSSQLTERNRETPYAGLLPLGYLQVVRTPREVLLATIGRRTF